MGETDEKETTPTAATTNGGSGEKPETPQTTTNDGPEVESKETEKLLGEDSAATGAAGRKNKSTENVAEKDGGEEIVNLPEAKDKDGQNGEQPPKETTGSDEPKSDKPNKVQAEEREVKPKKVPAGAFKLPGFFNKNKEKTKEADGADNELLEKGGENGADQGTEKGADGGETKGTTEEKPKRTGGFFANLKLRNPFAKKPVASAGQDDVEAGPKGTDGPEEEEKDEVTAEATDKPSVEGDADAETKKPEATAEAGTEEAPVPKRGLLDALRVPLASIIPKRFKPVANGEPDDDIELGKTPKNRAGLASMETLDDSLKDTETKDGVDGAKTGANGTDGETLVKPDDKEAKDKAAEAEEDAQERSMLQRIQGYRCSVDDIAIIAGIAIFVVLVALIVAFTFIGKGEPITAPVRDGKYIETVTTCGRVEGILEDGSFAFRGIPYAVPPTGENRWKPAQPIESIEHCWNGTLKAHNSTPVCWQFYADGKVDGAEDCLTLEVITPHVRYDNPLPVVVLIGAESFTGDSPGKLRPSTRYARSRDVIFVRPNFRLNVFGFLAVEQLTKRVHPPTSGNYGLTDLIAALKWIQLNIPHFGGDPKSVTLFGHRAGGTLVTALASSNKTSKLFARAWVSSGASIFPGKPLADSEKENALYVNKIRCTTADCLLEKEDEEILDAVPDVWRRTFPDLPTVSEQQQQNGNGTGAGGAASHEWLVLDGDILQQHPADVWSTDVSTNVRYVIGSTIHEAHNTKLQLKYSEWTPELVTKHVNESVIGQLGLTEEVLRRYNATYQGLVAMISDIRTICPLLTVTQKLPSSQFYVVSQTGGELGIADVDSDIQAILGRYEPKTPEQRRYVAAIQQLFYHYVSHGEIKHELRKKLLDIGQDALPTYNTDNCLFWIKNDIVPRYARLD
ncbi:neurotactin [Anopheles aquasalis]|uniref:neurotactin n=1 Tax=Anopheles aquasalis TaxID=42839 RepID=UPI00215B240C|nr:neurotactin [Anopheles aquasalis]XP_050096661.1 neurotactin [Anopheles aquasalis]XP_050096662.1 neurotactin [Anopheles aquasalis]XP_050096663.1 neurotactin [Anopheles aquasalis]XP_050096664.1 neurotactin [Anopheles aquasalis]